MTLLDIYPIHYPREMKIYTHKDFYSNVEGNFIHNSPQV